MGGSGGAESHLQPFDILNRAPGDYLGRNSSPRRGDFTALQRGNRVSEVLSRLVVSISIALLLYTFDSISLGGLRLHNATCCIEMRVSSTLILETFSATAFNLSYVVIRMQDVPNNSFTVVVTVCWKWFFSLIF